MSLSDEVFLSSSYTNFNGTNCLHAYIQVLAAEAKQQKKLSYFNSAFSEDLDASLIWYLASCACLNS